VRQGIVVVTWVKHSDRGLGWGKTGRFGGYLGGAGVIREHPWWLAGWGVREFWWGWSNKGASLVAWAGVRRDLGWG